MQRIYRQTHSTIKKMQGLRYTPGDWRCKTMTPLHYLTLIYKEQCCFIIPKNPISLLEFDLAFLRYLLCLLIERIDVKIDCNSGLFRKCYVIFQVNCVLYDEYNESIYVFYLIWYYIITYVCLITNRTLTIFNCITIL